MVERIQNNKLKTSKLTGGAITWCVFTFSCMSTKKISPGRNIGNLECRPHWCEQLRDCEWGNYVSPSQQLELQYTIGPVTQPTHRFEIAAVRRAKRGRARLECAQVNKKKKRLPLTTQRERNARHMFLSEDNLRAFFAVKCFLSSWCELTSVL